MILPTSPPWIAGGPRSNFPWRQQSYRLCIAAPVEDSTGSAEAPAAGTVVLHHAPSTTSILQLNSAAITDMAAYALSPPREPMPPTSSPPVDRILPRTRRRTSGATGTVPPPTVDYGSGPAGPLVCVHCVRTPGGKSHGRNRFRPSIRPLLLPARLLRRYPFRPADRDELVAFLFFGRLPRPGTPATTTTDIDALGAAPALQFKDSVARYSQDG